MIRQLNLGNALVSASLLAFLALPIPASALNINFTAAVGGTSGSLPWNYDNSPNWIYMGAGYNTTAYQNAYNTLTNPPTGFEDANATTVGVQPVAGSGYSTYTIAVKGAGTYSFGVLQPGTGLYDPTTYDLMSILYASSTTTTPFDPANPYTNLVALSDDANPPGSSANPYPLYYINTDSSACVTMTLAYFSWSGATSQANIQITGPGTVAASCTAINSVPNVALSLTGGTDPSALGQSLTFTATLSGGTSPTGTVDFQDNGAEIGCQNQPISGSTATCVVSSLALGAHSITAIYRGDTNNAAASSSTLAQTVLDHISHPVPTLDKWGLVVMSLLLSLAGLLSFMQIKRRFRKLP